MKREFLIFYRTRREAVGPTLTPPIKKKEEQPPFPSLLPCSYFLTPQSFCQQLLTAKSSPPFVQFLLQDLHSRSLSKTHQLKIYHFLSLNLTTLTFFLTHVHVFRILSAFDGSVKPFCIVVYNLGFTGYLLLLPLDMQYLDFSKQVNGTFELRRNPRKLQWGDFDQAVEIGMC